MDDKISKGGWYTPEDFRAWFSAFTRRLHLYEAYTTKSCTTAFCRFSYNWDKSLLVFRGKCFRSASRCATYSLTFCTTVVSEEIVSRYLSWGEHHELRWKSQNSLVISQWRYTRMIFAEEWRRKFCSSFKLYLKTSSTIYFNLLYMHI